MATDLRGVLMHAKEYAVDFFKRHEMIDHNRLETQIALLDVVIDGIVAGKEKFIIEVPTGGGKSIFGFLVVEFFGNVAKAYKQAEDATFELDDDFGTDNVAYMLTSNKMLQRQYDRDIKLFKFDRTVSLEGQSNYECTATGKPFSKRPCKKWAAKKLPSSREFGSCFTRCEYHQLRLKAIGSRNSIYNYSFFSTIMNIVYKRLGDFSPYEPRLFTFLDEAHMLRGIVQNSFEKVLNPWFIYQKFDTIAKRTIDMYCNTLLETGGYEFFKQFDEDRATFKQKMEQAQQYIMWYATQPEENWNLVMANNLITEVEKLKNTLSSIIPFFTKTISSKFPKDRDDYNETQEDFIVFLESLWTDMKSISFLIEASRENAFALVVDKEETKTGDAIKFRSANEADMIQRYIMSYTKYAILTSATIGHIPTFAALHGFKDGEYVGHKVASTFNFDNSPIYVIRNAPKLNYANKRENFPLVLGHIERIVNMPENENVNGIIHTGSFEFMNRVKKHFDGTRYAARFVYCRTADEKQQAVERTKHERGIILVGASLVEGIDLKDDQCRFSIHMKVPYPSLGDKLVKRKQKVEPDWYAYATLNDIIQAFGRPVRHKDDYARFYIVEGSFETFFNFNKGKLPKTEFTDRFKYIQWYEGKFRTDAEVEAVDDAMLEGTWESDVEETQPTASDDSEFNDQFAFMKDKFFS